MKNWIWLLPTIFLYALAGFVWELYAPILGVPLQVNQPSVLGGWSLLVALIVAIDYWLLRLVVGIQRVNTLLWIPLGAFLVALVAVFMFVAYSGNLLDWIAIAVYCNINIAACLLLGYWLKPNSV